MANLPMNVQARTHGTAYRAASPLYLGWNAAGSTFNVKREAPGRWTANATRYHRRYEAPTLARLAALLDHDHTTAEGYGAQQALLGATRRAEHGPLYVSWADGGRIDRATLSGLA